MKIALTKDGKRINIDIANINEVYYCPICKKEVLQKRGQIKTHHFAHFPNSNCFDSWHYEMSSWHYNWQNKFDIKDQEIIKTFQNKIHRADVLIEKEKTVIEFQHSNISIDEFEDRNYFYNKLGYKVIWLFDMREEFSNNNIGHLDNDDNNEKYYYLYPKKIFSNFDFKSNKVTLFFQIKDEENDDSIKIIKINWISPKGIYRFCGKEYNEEEFLSFCKNEPFEIQYKQFSIPYFLKKYPNSVMILKNRITLEEYLISKNSLDNLKKYHHIYGKTANSFGEFKNESVVIKDALEPNWILIWKPKLNKK